MHVLRTLAYWQWWIGQEISKKLMPDWMQSTNSGCTQRPVCAPRSLSSRKERESFGKGSQHNGTAEYKGGWRNANGRMITRKRNYSLSLSARRRSKQITLGNERSVNDGAFGWHRSARTTWHCDTPWLSDCDRCVIHIDTNVSGQCIRPMYQTNVLDQCSIPMYINVLLGRNYSPNSWFGSDVRDAVLAGMCSFEWNSAARRRTRWPPVPGAF